MGGPKMTVWEYILATTIMEEDKKYREQKKARKQNIKPGEKSDLHNGFWIGLIIVSVIFIVFSLANL